MWHIIIEFKLADGSWIEAFEDTYASEDTAHTEFEKKKASNIAKGVGYILCNNDEIIDRFRNNEN